MDFTIRPYGNDDESEVVDLWKLCNLIVPKNDPVVDIHEKMNFQPNLFLVGITKDTLIGSIMIGYEGHRGWINYLAIHPKYRMRGFGAMLMDHATTLLKSMGCKKINVQIRNSNISVIEFYKKCGFSDDDVVGYGKRI